MGQARRDGGVDCTDRIEFRDDRFRIKPDLCDRSGDCAAFILGGHFIRLDRQGVGLLRDGDGGSCYPSLSF